MTLRIKSLARSAIKKIVLEVLAEQINYIHEIKQDLADLREQYQKHIHDIGEKNSTSYTTGRPRTAGRKSE